MMESNRKPAVSEPTSAAEPRRKTWVRPTVKPVGELKELVQQRLSEI